MESYDKEIEKKANETGSCLTECAHIFAESTNANILGKNEGSDKVCHRSWFERFPY